MSTDPVRGTGTTAGRAPWLKGIVPPVCTPLLPDGEVDTASLERHIGFLLDAGVHGLFVLGSSGEAVYLTDAQRDRVVEVAVKVAGGQVPVLAGTIDMTTNRVVAQAFRAKQRGADGVVVTAPFYARTAHPAELKLHFRSVAERAGLPVVAYDIPISVQTKLSADVVLELASEGTLRAVKDSSNDIHGLRALVMGSRSLEDFAVFTGSELVIDSAFFLGAAGAVPGLANVDPHGFVAVYESCQAHQWDTARELQDRLFRLFDLTACGDPAKKGPSSSGLGGFKTALMLRGVIAHNAMALPQIPLDDREVAAVRAILEREGLL